MPSILVYFTVAFVFNAQYCFGNFLRPEIDLPSETVPRGFLIGDFCEATAECRVNLGDLSECIDNKCSCLPSYAVPSQSLEKCLPIINFIGGDCEESQQCTSGIPGSLSECRPSAIVPEINVCNCTNNAMNQPGRHKCLKKPTQIGDTCEQDFQCKLQFGDLSMCSTITNTCGCEEGAVANMEGSKPNSTCLPGGILIGSEGCTDMAQCVGIPGVSSACSGNYPSRGKCCCRGPHLMKEDKTDCLPIRNKVGESCEITDQCTMESLGEKGYCNRHSECECSGVANQDRNVCFPYLTRLNSTCTVNAQCTSYMGSLSQCVNFKCECKLGAYGSSAGGQGYDFCYQRQNS